MNSQKTRDHCIHHSPHPLQDWFILSNAERLRWKYQTDPWNRHASLERTNSNQAMPSRSAHEGEEAVLRTEPEMIYVQRESPRNQYKACSQGNKEWGTVISSLQALQGEFVTNCQMVGPLCFPRGWNFSPRNAMNWNVDQQRRAREEGNLCLFPPKSKSAYNGRY